MIFNFNEKNVPNLSQVGGKAKALIETKKSGFPVPDGIAISVDFFKPWLSTVKASNAFEKAVKDNTKENCEAVKALADNMKFSREQKVAFDNAIKDIDSMMFAVRSSSPEEDLEGISFAGMYETFLGTISEKLEQNIAKAFASCFDYRVMTYKNQNGIDPRNTSIAVVVQKQIASDISGVGFSLNPLNNDYDEILINSNFGLGESVVSGIVSPDQFIVDKINNEIKEKTPGGHEVIIDLKTDGGIVENKSNRDEFSLSDKKVFEVAKSIARIEDFYGFPVDVEWTYDGDDFYILQVRPITAFFALEEHMMTKPGEGRMLYMDANLVDALTSNMPILPLTIDWFYDAFMMFTGPLFGDAKLNGHLHPKDGLVFYGNGRVYANISQILHLGKLEKLMAVGEQADKQLTEISKNIDSKKYKMEKPLPYLKLGFLIRKFPRLIWNARKLIYKSIKAYFKPYKFYEVDFKPNVDRVIKKLKSDAYKDIPLAQITTIIDNDIDNVLFTYGFAAIIPLMVALDKIPKLVKDGTNEMDELSDDIFLGTEDNEAIDLGISMYHMAKLLKKSDFDNLDALSKKIKNRDMSDEFLSLWDKFVLINKFRGPNELELSNYRYGDRPQLALQQMSYMVDSEYNPEESQQKNIKKREKAYKKICSKLKGRKLKQFKINYDVAALYSTARDTPKYIWLLENGIVRERALVEGNVFVNEGLLDAKEDIFYLYYKEIEKAQSGYDIDLKEIVKERKSIYKMLDSIDSYPLFIDSRGNIPAAKVKEVKKGLLKGHGISRGIKTGRIKVMKNPTEKPINKGDVLVTYTTDPGWTPLFVNAEAVILQVGGPLQHGGVVAREYGKPCVAGIPNVYDQFHDGQLVEVDGSNGIVTIIEE